MSRSAELEGLAAVVTGGGSGIGLATARLLARAALEARQPMGRLVSAGEVAAPRGA